MCDSSDVKKQIPTQDRLKEVLYYDESTGIFVWKIHRGRVTTGTVAGAYRLGYIGIRVDGILYPAHRLAWLYVYGEWPEDEIDHIDLQRKNNRIINLRKATHQQNMRNTPLRSHSTTRLKGVRFDRNAYVAYITVNGKWNYLGRFGNPEDAHACYIAAAKDAFGEFARTK
jgi:hypothetical protein